VGKEGKRQSYRREGRKESCRTVEVVGGTSAGAKEKTDVHGSRDGMGVEGKKSSRTKKEKREMMPRVKEGLTGEKASSAKKIEETSKAVERGEKSRVERGRITEKGVVGGGGGGRERRT